MKRPIMALIGLMALALSACSDKPSWNATDISGVMPPLAFTLTDENGERATAADFRDKATLLFFGFTSCQEVCPTTLSRLSRLLDELDVEQQRNVRVLFVSVDPNRDTPEKLRTYTDNFGPQFVGLTGTQKQLQALNQRYRVTYGYGEPDIQGNYPVSHSAAVFGFSADDGKARILIRNSISSDAIRADLERLLSFRDHFDQFTDTDGGRDFVVARPMK